MRNLFYKIGEQINKTPFKVLFVSLGVAVLLITGALKVNMATGNETLVKADSEAFISNYEMEEAFGGDGIMVLLKGKEEDLLSQEIMGKMWNVEQRLQYNEDIYSFLSPASIVHQVTKKQSETITEKIPEISDGLLTMSENLKEIADELGGKELPDLDEMEAKLDDLMGNLDADHLFGDLLEKQDIEMAKMEDQIGTMSGGLGEMGSQLVSIGKELGTKNLPNSDELSKKFDSVIKNLDPEKLMDEMMGGQKENLEQMKQQVGQMSAGLSEMSKNLTEIGSNIQQMSGNASGDILEDLEQLENLPTAFDQLINGQNNLSQGITQLGGGLNETSNNLGDLASSLQSQVENIQDPELKQQLLQTVQILKQSANGLGNMAENTDDLKGGTTSTVTALSSMKTQLAEMIEKIKGSSSNNILPEQLEEMANGLIMMGQKLEEISSNINQIPNKIDGMLGGDGSTAALDKMIADMEKEISTMKKSLSNGIDPEELKHMSAGFVTMGENLGTFGSKMTNLPAELSDNLNLDPSAMLAEMKADLEKEVEVMKDSLDVGISPDDLKEMSDGFTTMSEMIEELSEGLTTFADKAGMMIPNFPHNQKELDEILYEDEKLRDIFADTIIDDEHVMFMIKLEGNLEDTRKDQVVEEVAKAMEAEDIGKRREYEAKASTNILKVFAMENEDEDDRIEYIVSGKPVLDNALREEMQINMQYMVVSAAIIMLIVLTVVFKVRWRILSLGVILVAVIATLGLMGHISVPMTMVSMAVFPILIGLGIDFSIQFHNRYEEEKSVTRTLTQTGKAIVLAVLVSMLGFVSLYASPVPMIQDFGKMLTIGVVVAFLGSIFLLMPILKARDFYDDSDNNKQLTASGEEEGALVRILEKTTAWVTRFAPIILLVVTLFAAGGQLADRKVGVETDIETFMPQDMAALKDIRYVRDIVGSTDQIVLYMEDEDILTEENIAWIQEKTKDLEDKYTKEVEDVKSIDSLVSNFADDEDLTFKEYIEQVDDLPENQSSMFINEDQTKASILMNIKHMGTNDLEKFIEDITDDIQDAPMDIQVTGQSVLDVEMVEGLTGGRVKMTFLGIGLVFLGLFLVYRNAVRALVPVIPVFLVVGMSGGIMYLLGLSYTPITATLGALVLGMGTETTIMILERYIEERESGKNKRDALDITITRIGKATLSTEFTTMGGFSVLAFSNFVILKDFGLMTVISVSLIMTSTFLVLPAVIWLLDPWIIREKDLVEV